MRERNGTADKVRELADKLPGWWRLAALREAFDAAYPGPNWTLYGMHLTSGAITGLLNSGVIEKRRIAENYASKRGEARHFEYRFKRRRQPKLPPPSAMDLRWREFKASLMPKTQGMT